MRTAAALATLAALGLLAGCTAPSARDVAPSLAARGEPAGPVDPVIAAEPWDLDDTPGLAIETPHYVINTTLGDSVLRGRTPRFAELALAHYTTAIAELPRPTRKMRTFLLATRPQWLLVTQRTAGRAASTIARIQRGGYATGGTAVYWDIGAHDTLAIAAHEGWHQYTQSAFRDRLPIWLEEGLACYMEGFRWSSADPHTPRFLPWANTERFDRLRELVDAGRAVPLPELLDARPADLIVSSSDGTLDYYAQVWALAHFLNEGDGGRYAGRLRRLLLDAAAGSVPASLAAELTPREVRLTTLSRRGPGVFLAYFDRDLAGASAGYDAFLSRVTAPGARTAVSRGDSPLAR